MWKVCHARINEIEIISNTKVFYASLIKSNYIPSYKI
jgi:hypothetical protein